MNRRDLLKSVLGAGAAAVASRLPSTPVDAEPEPRTVDESFAALPGVEPPTVFFTPYRYTVRIYYSNSTAANDW